METRMDRQTAKAVVARWDAAVRELAAAEGVSRREAFALMCRRNRGFREDFVRAVNLLNQEGRR